MEMRTWTPLMVTLTLWLASYHAEACSCVAIHLQRDFCLLDVAIKGKFLNATGYDSDDYVHDYNEVPYYMYSVQVMQVFKGSEKVQNKPFVSRKTTCKLYVSPSEFNIDYVITGFIRDGQVDLMNCNYIRRWSDLSPRQIKGIQGAYSKGCSCKIGGYWIPESKIPSDTCVDNNWNENLMCAPNEHGICTWQAIQD